MRPIVAHEVSKWERRSRRAFHVGNSIFGTKERPRLSIYRSNRHFHSQLIDDAEGRTLAAASTVMKELKTLIKNGGDKKAAAMVGQKLAEVAKAKGITKVVFDRSYYRFHGRVKAFAEAAAKGGLDFLFNPKKKDKPPKVRKEKAKPAEKPKKEKKGPPTEGGAPPQGKPPSAKGPEGKPQGQKPPKPEGKPESKKE
jgi:large subunit ribosomal protein L18